METFIPTQRSKSNKMQNMMLELTAWIYCFFQMLLSMTFGIIYEENRRLIAYIYKSYLKKQSESFLVQYLVVLIFIPHIFIWDRFLAKRKTGGLAVRMIYKQFGRTLPLEHDLKSLPIEAVFDVPVDGYVLAETAYEGGNTTLLELAYLCNIVKTIQPKVCLEIGTFNGRSTLHIALNAPNDTKIYTLDLPEEDREPSFKNIKLIFEKQKYNYLGSKIKKLFGDSKKYDFEFLKNSVDFIFVDGAHSEDYLLNDSKLALKLLRKGGTILWHDYTVWDGVTSGIDLFAKTNPTLNMIHLKESSMVVFRDDQP